MKQFVMSPVTLSFLAILVFFGCGDDLEKDTNLLASDELLASEEPYRFQALPVLEDGSLIPLDEIPVVSVELITDDPADGFFTWRLKANPVPTREDLVVLVDVWGDLAPVEEAARLLVIRKNQNSSKKFKAIIRPVVDWRISISIQPQANIPEHLIRRQPTKDRYLAEIRRSGLSVETNDGYVIPPDFIFPYYVPGERIVLHP